MTSSEKPVGRAGTGLRTSLFRFAVLCVLLTVLITGVTAGATASGIVSATDGVAQNQSNAEQAPQNATYEVVVTPKSPTSARITVEISYEARTDAELQRARNGTLDSSWFRGEAIIEQWQAARNNSSDSIEDVRLMNDVSEEGTGRTIVRSTEATWTPFIAENTNQTVLGPSFAAVLHDGDEFRVRLYDATWENWNASTEGVYTRQRDSYTFRWTIGEEPPPRLILERTDHSPPQNRGCRSAAASCVLVPVEGIAGVAVGLMLLFVALVVGYTVWKRI